MLGSWGQNKITTTAPGETEKQVEYLGEANIKATVVLYRPPIPEFPGDLFSSYASLSEWQSEPDFGALRLRLQLVRACRRATVAQESSIAAAGVSLDTSLSTGSQQMSAPRRRGAEVVENGRHLGCTKCEKRPDLNRMYARHWRAATAIAERHHNTPRQ